MRAPRWPSNLLQLVARPLSDRLLSTYGVWAQRTELPTARRGILWESSGQAGPYLRGRFGGRPSLWTPCACAAFVRSAGGR